MTGPLSEQEMEQLLVTVENMAIEVASYYQKLVLSGVPPAEASKLTGTFQMALLGLFGKPNDRLEKGGG
jgi:hypothetical protein